MTNKITLKRADLDLIMEIVLENEIEHWTLTQDSSSGIGYTIDLEYRTDVNGRPATIIIPIATTEDW
jgi:hypothetical protein